jgi:hypothetical protein
MEEVLLPISGAGRFNGGFINAIIAAETSRHNRHNCATRHNCHNNINKNRPCDAQVEPPAANQSHARHLTPRRTLTTWHSQTHT